MHIYRPHIAPVLGDKHPKNWTREDCERLVTELDKKITAGTSWKTVANVWSLFTKACKVASSAKAGTELRVRSDNPCAGVEGPDRGAKKSKQGLYLSEFEQLIACKDVPLRWRRLYALLAYTYVRPGELRALTWADVNLQVGTIHVTKAWDEKLHRLPPPKTGAGVRYVPIEATLAPLLETLSEGAQAADLVVSRFPPMEDWAAKFRRHLQGAGVTRAELFADTETHKQITLYDLRATGITWRCLREDYGSQIQEAAGHEKFDTTNGYIRTARVFVGRLGHPFPALPASLLGGGGVSITSFDQRGANPTISLRPQRELKTRPDRAGKRSSTIHARSGVRRNRPASQIAPASTRMIARIGPNVGPETSCRRARWAGLSRPL
jgi:integrase